MKLIMGISRDRYVARSATDDMSWLGPSDKAVFRLLTVSSGGVLGVGSKTAAYMPKKLEGRKLLMLSRKSGISLKQFEKKHPNGWLIGGQKIALTALEDGYIDEAYLCHSDRYAFPEKHDGPIPDYITSKLHSEESWSMEMTIKFGDTRVECWRRQWR